MESVRCLFGGEILRFASRLGLHRRRGLPVFGGMKAREAEKSEWANQSLEPTTTAVTIPAAQEVAPAVVVAHL